MGDDGNINCWIIQVWTKKIIFGKIIVCPMFSSDIDLLDMSYIWYIQIWRNQFLFFNVPINIAEGFHCIPIYNGYSIHIGKTDWDARFNNLIIPVYFQFDHDHNIGTYPRHITMQTTFFLLSIMFEIISIILFLLYSLLTTIQLSRLSLVVISVVSRENTLFISTLTIGIPVRYK